MQLLQTLALQELNLNINTSTKIIEKSVAKYE
jgi:hypothetical protein